jgi:hypothetical protein
MTQRAPRLIEFVVHQEYDARFSHLLNSPRAGTL